MLKKIATSLVGLLFIAGAWLSSEALAAPDSQKLYTQHCVRCHGDSGTGDGPAYTLQRPRPRDFTQGQYKFRSTPLNTLPTTGDIANSIRHGNLRTSMPPFEKYLSEEEIQALANYILQFSKKHSELPDGTPFVLTPALHLNEVQPTPEILKQGQAIFEKQCFTCHGMNGRGLGDLTPLLYDENQYWVKVPDLTDVLEYGGGSKTSDIYMRLESGIGLSGMPLYKDALDQSSKEAVSHYVKSLQVPSEERELISKEEWNAKLPPKVRGEYMVRAMSCALCHNAYDEQGNYYPDMYMAGGVRITLPGLGEFYTKNITSHPIDGLADWTEEEIIQTVTTGRAPDRQLEAFSMPWTFFYHLTEEDAKDMAAFVKSLPPIQNRVPDREFYPFWKRLYQRIRQLFGLEYGRLAYPPFNQGERDEQ